MGGVDTLYAPMYLSFIFLKDLVSMSTSKIFHFHIIFLISHFVTLKNWEEKNKMSNNNYPERICFNNDKIGMCFFIFLVFPLMGRGYSCNKKKKYEKEENL